MRWAVFLSSELDLDEIASALRRLLGLSTKNPTEYQRDQLRYSLNMGGTYYLFEVLGFELLLLVNRGEVLIEERSAFDYYLGISGVTAPVGEELAVRIARQLSECGIVAEPAELH